ncbi:ASCH domain-containing protein [Variovorax ureilyticus]|uniref:ASCH domain-containing protein n=1 Tax=Variovorax ureilyticus TaxID=1836198 RepID=UPI003D67DA61
MNVPSSIATFWEAIRAEGGGACSAKFYEAFHFADNEFDANALASLVLAGVKRATASLVWSFENEGRSPPEPGALSVVTYWDGRPACVIETLEVEVLPFEQVDAAFAASEGKATGRWGTGGAFTGPTSAASACAWAENQVWSCLLRASGSVSCTEAALDGSCANPSVECIVRLQSGQYRSFAAEAEFA